MKKFKFLALAMALVMMFTAFVGCKSVKDTTQIQSSGNLEINAEKIGSVDIDSISIGKTGTFYKDKNDKYGIISLDGKKNTGAKYTACEPVGNYFNVSLSGEATPDDVSSINKFGVVDANGKEIIPMEYAVIKEISDRYIKVSAATKRTANKDNALIYLHSGFFHNLSAVEGDILFEGVWYIYDVTTGQKVPGATGTNAYTVSAKGNFITFRNDDGKSVILNNKGEKLPTGAKLFNNGFYRISADQGGTVYDSDGNKLFDYLSDDFTPHDSTGDYLVVTKQLDDGTSKYAFTDQNGKIVSANFNSNPIASGNLVLCDNKAYKMDGTAIIDGNVKHIYQEKHYGNAYFLVNDKEYTLVKEDGTILYSGTEDDIISFDTLTTFTIQKKSDNTNLYYCFADNDFTLEGKAFAPWLVKTKNSDKYDIVDTLTGKTIINGYKDYRYITVENSYIYVYAYKEEGGIDIYTIQ